MEKINSKIDRYIRNKLRLAWRYYSLNRKECLSKFNGKCAICGKKLAIESVHVDHKIPVVEPKEGFKDWNIFIIRLFCDTENLWCICRQCHKDKTHQEDLERKANKTGRYSKKAIQSMSESLKGHTFLRGIPKTVAHKRAMSLERKGKPQTKARIEAQKKAVETQKISVIAIDKVGQRFKFDSLRTCANHLNLIESNISRVLRKDQNRTQHKGWRFEYA